MLRVAAEWLATSHDIQGYTEAVAAWATQMHVLRHMVYAACALRIVQCLCKVASWGCVLLLCACGLLLGVAVTAGNAAMLNSLLSTCNVASQLTATFGGWCCSTVDQSHAAGVRGLHGDVCILYAGM
jgi:hypothetical protein